MQSSTRQVTGSSDMIPYKVKFCQVTASRCHTSAPPGHPSRAHIELRLLGVTPGSRINVLVISAFGQWPGRKACAYVDGASLRLGSRRLGRAASATHRERLLEVRTRNLSSEARLLGTRSRLLLGSGETPIVSCGLLCGASQRLSPESTEALGLGSRKNILMEQRLLYGPPQCSIHDEVRIEADGPGGVGGWFGVGSCASVVGNRRVDARGDFPEPARC
jgi:hypothetical protein